MPHLLVFSPSVCFHGRRVFSSRTLLAVSAAVIELAAQTAVFLSPVMRSIDLRFKSLHHQCLNH